MKTYIISFFQDETSEEDLVSYLDTKSEVLNWLIPLPNTVFIASKRDASFITRLIEKKFPESLFIAAEYSPHKADGLLSEEMWEFLNHPEKA